MPDPVGTSLVLETSTVRIWDLVLEAGQATTVHEHLCDYVYVVVEAGDTETVYADGTALRHKDAAGDAVYVRKDQPHKLVNRGTSTYVNVVIELLTVVDGESQ